MTGRLLEKRLDLREVADEPLLNHPTIDGPGRRANTIRSGVSEVDPGPRKVTVETDRTFSIRSLDRGTTPNSRDSNDTTASPPSVLVTVIVAGDENHASTPAPPRQASAMTIRSGGLSDPELILSPRDREERLERPLCHRAADRRQDLS